MRVPPPFSSPCSSSHLRGPSFLFSSRSRGYSCRAFPFAGSVLQHFVLSSPFSTRASHPGSLFIHDSSVLMGNMTIGEDCSVWPLVVLRADVNSISVGQRTNIQDGTVIHCARASESSQQGHRTEIGSDVTIGHKCLLHGCTIEDRVLIGMGSVVMDGAYISSDVILGAGSLVPPGKTLDSGIWVGRPAKKLRDVTKDDQQAIMDNVSHYVSLKNSYLTADKRFKREAAIRDACVWCLAVGITWYIMFYVVLPYHTANARLNARST